MPFFMIERGYAERLKVTSEGAAAIDEINDEASVRWLISFLSVDKKRTFCLYEAPNPAAIREAARRAGIPVDAFIEVSKEIMPNGTKTALQNDRYERSSLD